MHYMPRRLAAVAFLALAVTLAGSAVAAAQTTVPGHTGRTDTDGNGFPDAGQIVNGRYTTSYVAGSTVCRGTVIYRGDFGNDPHLDSGVITNHWLCKGPDGTIPYYYQIVHETDPRYTGNPDWAIWDTWEFHVLTEGGSGNLVRRPFTG